MGEWERSQEMKVKEEWENYGFREEIRKHAEGEKELTEKEIQNE